VITHKDSSPTNTERLRLIPVSIRKIIDSRELTIQLETLGAFSTVYSFHMECKQVHRVICKFYCNRLAGKETLGDPLFEAGTEEGSAQKAFR